VVDRNKDRDVTAVRLDGCSQLSGHESDKTELVSNTFKQGLVTYAIELARQKGGLKVPVTFVSPKGAPAHFGWITAFTGRDLPASVLNIGRIEIAEASRQLACHRRHDAV